MQRQNGKRYGIKGKTLQWLTEFLKDRLQTVVVEGTKSSFQLVISGVPQGTVLGPILFILYIDDQLDTLVTALGKVFADDTKLIGKIMDLATKSLLQDDLLNVIAWALKNNMQLNEAKFEILNYSLNNSLLLRKLPFTSQYSCYNLPNGRTIDPAKTVRDLGVLLSNDCSWSSHIQQMAKTARTMTSWVLSVFRDRSLVTLPHAHSLQNHCRKQTRILTGDTRKIFVSRPSTSLTRRAS